MQALENGLDWRLLFREVTEQGAAFAARAVRQPVCDQLAEELRGGPYQPVAPEIGPVRQEAEAFEVSAAGLDRYPVLTSLWDELVGQVRQHGVPEWAPTEAAVQRYQPGSLGITAHRDQRRFARLVAVITVTGRAPFMLCRNREGDPVRTWQASEGSLVLLRGPGLDGNPDGRPMHAVGGPAASPRTSVGIRMDTA
ncbi:MAG TPA: hypothetical protein VGL88_02710 [Pseudonocardiaceae bacterium]|jgi:hypothetical protein